MEMEITHGDGMMDKQGGHGIFQSGHGGAMGGSCHTYHWHSSLCVTYNVVKSVDFSPCTRPTLGLEASLCLTIRAKHLIHLGTSSVTPAEMLVNSCFSSE